MLELIDQSSNELLCGHGAHAADALAGPVREIVRLVLCGGGFTDVAREGVLDGVGGDIFGVFAPGFGEGGT